MTVPNFLKEATHLLIRWDSNPRTLGSYPPSVSPAKLLTNPSINEITWCRYFRFFLLKTLRFLHLEKVNHILGGQDGVLAVYPKTPSVKPFEASATSLFRTMPNLLSISFSIEPVIGFEPTWPFGSWLQIRCNQPLCDTGLWQSIFFK